MDLILAAADRFKITSPAKTIATATTANKRIVNKDADSGITSALCARAVEEEIKILRLVKRTGMSRVARDLVVFKGLKKRFKYLAALASWELFPDAKVGVSCVSASGIVEDKVDL